MTAAVDGNFEHRPASATTRVAIFASGAGSNAKKIIEHFAGHGTIQIDLIVCNKPGAGVLTIAVDNRIRSLIIEKERFFRGDGYVAELKSAGIGFIVLAGFLWKVPNSIVQAFAGKIINIHPALLPKYGGKGMYGAKVHEAVLAAGEAESGITIHYVDGHYDNGDVIFQAICPVAQGDTPDSLATKIHELEHRHFAVEIERCIKNK